MNKLFTFLLFGSSLCFGQFISEAKLELKNGNIIDAKNIIIQEKGYEYTDLNYPYTLQQINKKNVVNLKFDSINYTKEIPKIKESYFENNLPEGLYETIEDFYKGVPTSTEKIVGEPAGRSIYERENDLMKFTSSTKKVIKNPFAIVYNGELFFGIRGIDKHESKEMKGGFVLLHAVNTYLRVKYKTDDYYYTDMPLKTTGQLIASSAVGGALGAVILPSSANRDNYRPVVLINNEKKFYIVKNCKRFNDYFESKLNLTYNCENEAEKEYNIMTVRKLIIKE